MECPATITALIFKVNPFVIVLFRNQGGKKCKTATLRAVAAFLTGLHGHRCGEHPGLSWLRLEVDALLGTPLKP